MKLQAEPQLDVHVGYAHPTARKEDYRVLSDNRQLTLRQKAQDFASFDSLGARQQAVE
jgi:hypothetical protein